MTISEVRSYLQQNFPKDEMFYTSNNERFRRNLYDVYLGGLDMEKFPRLFKRAIPFKMNIRLEDFVKEYICMEQDIHIEDMQEGAMLYGRMCRKIESHDAGDRRVKADKCAVSGDGGEEKELLNCHYRMDKLTILQLEQTIEEMQHRVENWKKDVVLQNESLAELLEIKGNYEKSTARSMSRSAGTGYARLEEQLKSLEENLSLLERSKNKLGWYLCKVKRLGGCRYCFEPDLMGYREIQRRHDHRRGDRAFKTKPDRSAERSGKRQTGSFRRNPFHE